MPRIGVVSFLNSRPLIEGLEHESGVALTFDVPALLPGRLLRDEVDVALVPIVDVLRHSPQLEVVSDACIACDGETMTVRVFSQTPPDRIDTLYVDGDSHTSIALASVLWQDLFDRRLTLRSFDARTQNVSDCPAVLLIGDKVVQTQTSFAYEVDLGGAWRQHTGLPFVFAVWAMKRAAARPDLGSARAALFDLLSAARDRGVARARPIAEAEGPKRWWPTDLAVRYLTRCLKFKLDARYLQGADRFARRCVELGLVPAGAEIAWPERLVALAAAESPS